MCQPSPKLQLCTCSNTIFPPIKKQPIRYVWNLKKYVGPSTLGMDGICIEPQTKLNEILSAEFVVQQLNETNIFDFDYTPQKLDCLTIERLEKKKRGKVVYSLSEFMKFQFINQQWVIGGDDPFADEMAMIEKGKVKLTSLQLKK